MPYDRLLTEPLSDTMSAALMVAREHGGKLTRLPGGFWTFDGCPRNNNTPLTFFGTTTIKGLVWRGHMEFTQWRRKTKQHDPFPVEAQTVDDVEI